MDATEISPVTRTLSEYIAGTLGRALPGEVVEKTKLHILDTLAAAVSGAQLKAGHLATRYAEGLGGPPEATIIGTGVKVSAMNAALANGMSAHADETDDSHLGGRFHPGCAIIPAAWAVAEQQSRSGDELIKSVALGYDVGARLTPALGPGRPDTTRYSTHSLAGAFGAAASAAALHAFGPREVRFVLSYAAQQASGIPFWQRDHEHIEKAFDFGGMGARNGVAAAGMVKAGFTAVEDCLSGRHNLLAAFGEAPNAPRLVDGLGEDFEILRASIKKWCVGSPIQAALDSLEFLMKEYSLRADQVQELTVYMPDDRLHVVDSRTMPDICLQHLLAVMLLDGGLTFESSHDYKRMSDPKVLELRNRIKAVPSAELTHATPARQAIVEITTVAGERLTRRTYCVRGTPDNPMNQAEVEAKAVDLLTPVLGRHGCENVIGLVSRLEELETLADLSALLRG